MPLEGHGTDCDCGCCGFEAEPKVQAKCVCPACGKQVPQEAGQACGHRKCPSCGAELQPGK